MKRSWEERYRQRENFDTPPLDLLVSFTEGLRPGVALDLACGPGRHALLLAARGWRVEAVDSAPSAIAALLAHRHPAIDAQVADLEDPSYRIEPGKYDLICDTYYLDRALLPAIGAGVRPGGHAFFVIPLTDPDPLVAPFPERFLLEPGELEACLSGWTLLHAAERKIPGKRRAAELIAQRPETP